MAMMVTNQQVLKFYADKLADGATCPRTKDYLEELKKKEIEQLKESEEADQKISGKCLHGPYKELAQVFKAGISADWENRDLNKDKQFYIWMKCHEMFTWLLESTCGLSRENIFLEKTDYYQVELQKWHLYVSYYAYLESGLCEHCFTLKEKAPNFLCPELLLWMCEAAKSGKTECFYDELLEIEADDHKDVWNRIRFDWAPKVRKEIERIISEE